MAILIVEDETDLSDILRFILRRAGHSVISAPDGQSALRLWREQDPDLALIDVGLPDMSGLEVCRVIKSSAETPVVFLTASQGDDHMIQALNLGADDYITKPFNPSVLQARVAAVLRRASGSNQTHHQTEELHLDHSHQTAVFEGRSVRLTGIEFRMLSQLLAQPDCVVPHDDLSRLVWGYTDETGSKTLKGHVHNLRRKLVAISFRGTLDVVAGRGYVLRTSLPLSQFAAP
jgi:two-component system OmpR family response regulator